jgi:ferredoxin|tara:strand:+ start:2042 stop:2203 length:162 start_codon:yes stop_codon:yes gene_type:complete
MAELLLYSGILCEDADAIILKVQEDIYLKNEIKVELVETIQDATPECPWDAND